MRKSTVKKTVTKAPVNKKETVKAETVAAVKTEEPKTEAVEAEAVEAKTEEKENDHATEILQNTSQNEAENYHFLPEHHLYDGGPKAKFRNNVEAIRLLKSL